MFGEQPRIDIMAANLPKELLQKLHAEEDLMMATEGKGIDEEVGIEEEEADQEEDQEEDNGTCVSCTKSKKAEKFSVASSWQLGRTEPLRKGMGTGTGTEWLEGRGLRNGTHSWFWGTGPYLGHNILKRGDVIWWRDLPFSTLDIPLVSTSLLPFPKVPYWRTVHAELTTFLSCLLTYLVSSSAFSAEMLESKLTQYGIEQSLSSFIPQNALLTLTWLWGFLVTQSRSQSP